MFDIKSFESAFAVFTAKVDVRGELIASWLGNAATDAAASFLVEGSDVFDRFLSKLHGSGKSANAVKVRKAMRAVSFEGFAPWGKLSFVKEGFSFTKAQGFIGGNSPRVKDQDKRYMACEEFGTEVSIAIRAVFASKVSEGVPDPLESFGAWSEKTIVAKFAKASDEQVDAAYGRVKTLLALLETENQRRLDLDLEPVEPVEPELIEPSEPVEPVEPELIEPSEPELIEPSEPAKKTRSRKLAVAA